ncbi:unnamed protein product [Allacma fusca]|uniref:Alpha-1,6-mannosyl-glycoprotein 2-beta-N-acetylglucosaminyltransferase n=1 Tax=Allacma fusca TaxID=39272 RepID=A0A8J2MHI4_9HEXA|nr:unnamed protein product [Allacma fusca]
MVKILCKSSKTFLIVLVITLIWLHTYLSGILGTENSVDKSPRADDDKIPGAAPAVVDETGKNGNTGGGSEHGRLGTPAFINLPEPRPLSAEEIEEITKEMTFENEMQRIYNVEKFGPVNEGTYVLVIQVHSRVEYLSLLIESLSRVQNIENSLLVFSHDLYVPQLNEAIRNIDFTRVMQIFYPYSIQLHPTSFPGQSPDDCPRDISPEKAQQTKCRNADHPDVYGHYREARYTQTKHHWWWKANFVFGKIVTLRNYTGVVAFIEEDHYVAPDFLWVLDLMETLMVQNLCHGCNLLALGTYLKTWNIKVANSRGVVTNWISSKHNMGMAFNRTMWNEISRCAPTFCEYDDYNWDWSLLQVAYTCLHQPMTVFYAKAPRIFHIGDCGMHYKQKKCNPHTAAKAIDAGVKTHHALLFPDKLTVEVRHGKNMRLKKGNGGWGDIRDKQLCLSFSKDEKYQF